MYTKEGKPRLSIISIAHLSDQERMFFVTIFLNELFGMDAFSARYEQSTGTILHGRSLWLLPANSEAAK